MPNTITVSELRREPPSHLQLVDVRSPSEFASGHIPGAVNIPMDQIESRLQDLGRDVFVVLICQAGKRARMTADLIAGRSPQKLAILEGGTNAWIQAELPLVCCAKTRWSLERQVRLIAGVLALTGAILALTVHSGWVFLSAFVGLGLTFAGITDICPMAILLGRMPWNGPRRCATQIPVSEPTR